MKNRTNNVLDDERIGRLLLKLSLPAFFGMFVMTLYNVVDTIFIGHYVGHLGIAGLSIVFPIQMFSIGIGQMTGMGGASLISRFIGADKISRAERVLGNVITSTILVSVIITICGLVAPDFWLRLMGSSETILPYARDYFVVIIIGTFSQTLAMALNGVVRAEGNAHVAMKGMIFGALLNIILDSIFIIPLGMGIQGAALATVIAQIISMAYLLRYYFSEKSFLQIHSRNLLIEFKILKSILAIGIASFTRMLASSLSVIFINRICITYGGDYAVSAYGIINRIMMFAIMPGIVIGQGLQPVLGFNYGAKRYKKALKTVLIAIVAATVCSIIVFLILFLLPEPFIRIFTSDSKLIAQGAYAAKRVFLALYLVGFGMVGSLTFQSIGKATQSFITAVARPALFLIPLVFILPRFLQLDGVWLAFPIADALAVILILVLLIPQLRQFRKMVLSAKLNNDAKK